MLVVHGWSAVLPLHCLPCNIQTLVMLDTELSGHYLCLPSARSC